MKLGVFSMPLHRPEKLYEKALSEDREMVLLAEQLGFSEYWMGEHFTSKVEQIPSAMLFFSSLISETKKHQIWHWCCQSPSPSSWDRCCRSCNV